AGADAERRDVRLGELHAATGLIALQGDAVRSRAERAGDAVHPDAALLVGVEADTKPIAAAGCNRGTELSVVHRDLAVAAVSGGAVRAVELGVGDHGH